MKPLRPGLALFVLVLLLAAGPWAPAGAAGPSTNNQEPDSGLALSARAGLDGAYREDAWLPVTVQAANEGPDVEGFLQVAVSRGGGDETLYRAPISLPTRSDKRTTFYVPLAGAASRLTIELRDERGRLLAEVESNRLQRLPAGEPLYGVVGNDPGVWTSVEQAAPRGVRATVAHLALEELPDLAAGLHALDVLILSNVDSARLPAAQIQAIRAWLDMGGQLVLAGGSAWRETTAAFEQLLPVTIDGVASVPDLPQLAARMGAPLRDPGPYLLTHSVLRSGEALLREGDLPLLARRDVGRGALYFLALDPALPPLLDWRGSEQMWAQIGENRPLDPPWAAGPRNPYNASSALLGLPALALPPLGALLCFLGLYVLAVGPLNYLVLRRMGRRELAWVSIPLLVLIFSGLAYVAGFGLRGNHVVLNQVTVAYGALDGQSLHNATLLGIFSPRRAAYDVHLPAQALARPFSREFGGMTGSGSEQAISRTADVVLQQVRVDVSGIESYLVNAHTPLPPLAGSARLSLQGSDARIAVDLQNNGDLALQTAGLLAGNNYFELGDLQPGARLARDFTLSGGLPTSLSSGPRFGAPNTLSMHYDKILGTTDFYSDRAVQARYQLLESLQNYAGGPAPQLEQARDALTLVAWSQQPQLAVSIPQLGNGVAHEATTLYFLELPIENIVAGGQGLRVPPALLEWQIDSPTGAYITGITDFYLPPGIVDISYTPWPAFQQMAVTELQLNLSSADAAARVPEVLLWDWQREVWQPLPVSAWGNILVSGFERHLGPDNELRLRLNNAGAVDAISIEAVYPVLIGDLP